MVSKHEHNEHSWLSQFLDVTFSRPSLNDNVSFALTLNRFDASRLKAMRGKNGSNNQSNRSGC